MESREWHDEWTSQEKNELRFVTWWGGRVVNIKPLGGAASPCSTMAAPASSSENDLLHSSVSPNKLESRVMGPGLTLTPLLSIHAHAGILMLGRAAVHGGASCCCPSPFPPPTIHFNWFKSIAEPNKQNTHSNPLSLKVSTFQQFCSVSVIRWFRLFGWLVWFLGFVDLNSQFHQKVHAPHTTKTTSASFHFLFFHFHVWIKLFIYLFIVTEIINCKTFNAYL